MFFVLYNFVYDYKTMRLTYIQECYLQQPKLLLK
jgi:hypothetical protein